MATFTFEQITEIIVKNPHEKLIADARKANKLFMLHTHGLGMKEAIKQEDYFENADIYKTRQELAVSNKDLLCRTLEEEEQVFTARGGSAHFNLSESEEEEMYDLMDNVVMGINLREWVHIFALQAYRNDPMGIIFMEVESLYETDGVEIPMPKCYPTYKSIQGIYDYQPNGRNLEYVCFQLTIQQLADYGINDPDYVLTNDNTRVTPPVKPTPYFRFVDDAQDVIVKKIDEKRIIIAANTKQQNPIKNHWGKVPGFIASNLFKFDKPNCFASPLGYIIELCQSFLTDRSMRDLQKKYHGFAKAVEPLLKCPTCAGTGEAKGNACPDCTPPGHNVGLGYKLRTKISEVSKFPMDILEAVPRFDFRNIFGYVTPDIESWKQQDATLDQLEQLIYYTYWGVGKATQVQGAQAPGKTGDKTAFEVGSNLKPKYSRLNNTANWAEVTENLIVDFIGQFWFDSSYKTGTKPISYGRNYILETPQDLWKSYSDMRVAGAPDFLLDEALERYLNCLYQSSPVELAKYIKLTHVEPFPHILPADAKAIIPKEEDYWAKVYFGEWYDTLADIYIIDTPIEKLRTDLATYVKGKDIPPTPVEPIVGDVSQNDAGAAGKVATSAVLKN